MTRLNSLVLKLLVILSAIGQVVTIALSLLISGVTILLAASKHFRNWAFYHDSMSLNNSTLFTVFMNCITALVMLASLFVLLKSVKNIISNINNKKFFVESNLSLLRNILISTIIFTVFNFIDKLLADSKYIHDTISSLPINSFYTLIILGFIYVIYIVFEYGLKLQNESDHIMLDKKISSKELAQQVGITPANLSILKAGKARGVRFSTLNKICEVLNCQLGDIIKYVDEGR